MLSQTYDLTAILDLPLSSALSLLNHARQQEDDNVVWQMWLAIYPDMYKGHTEFVSFVEYKERLVESAGQSTPKTPEEILEEFTPLINSRKGGEESGNL